MHRTEELLLATAPEWSHETVLACSPASGLARAFVSHHLVAHRLYHLVDVAGVVAVKLASDACVRTRPRGDLTLTLSKADTVVLLRVEDASRTEAATEATHAVGTTTYGDGVVGLLSLQWGVTRDAGEAIGLWATFDARRHRHAVATVEDSMTFTGGPPHGAEAR